MKCCSIKHDEQFHAKQNYILTKEFKNTDPLTHFDKLNKLRLMSVLTCSGILARGLVSEVLAQWFLTWVRSNPSGSMSLFQGFSGKSLF